MPRDYLNLLCDAGELSSLMAGSADIGSFLQHAVELVARHLEADVCSIYLCEGPGNALVLRANVGLKPGVVGSLRLESGQGLVGRVLEQRRPLRTHEASRHPDFRYFPEAGEDRFESFLGIPILRGAEAVGVLVVQRTERRPFAPDDVLALRAIASQLAGAIANARLLMDLQSAPPERSAPEGMRVLHGTPASPGTGHGRAALLERTRSGLLAVANACRRGLPAAAFENALVSTADQLQALQGRVDDRLPEVVSLIFTAHLMMLKDDSFVGAMRRRIAGGADPVEAVVGVAQSFADLFESSPHAYMREKAQDVEDLARRILENLGCGNTPRSTTSEDRIVVARHLYPSDIVTLATEGASGLVLIGGGFTTHVSILARSLEIPMVILRESELTADWESRPLIVDGVAGLVYVDPTPETLQRFQRTLAGQQTLDQRAADMLPETRTRDGARVRLMANINLLHELRLAVAARAEGVGLYRTEFPFMIRSTFPSEEEQTVAYRRLIDGLPGREITFRTLDIGGDKALAYFDHPDEDNPALGLRSIRLLLRYPEILLEQLRAILRAGAAAERLRIMFPMVSSLDEFRAARALVDRAADGLAEAGVPHHARPAVGVMIELPSLAATIEDYVREADFFSIGTNDFVQYMLGVDRGNESVAGHFRPHHPAVLRTLARVARAVTEAGKDLSVCGEMARQTEYLPFLVGIGVRTLSVDPHELPDVQRAVGGMDMTEAQQHARRLLGLSTLAEIESFLGLEV